MFDKPKQSKTFTPPPNLDIEERYLFKLIQLTDEGVSNFADPAKGETFHNIAWHMNVALASSRQALLGADGNPWEYIEYTTSKTGRNPKNGMVAKARLFIEAFLGHGIEDDEITADLPSKLVGHYATGFFELADRQAQDGTEYQKLQVLKLSPYKASAPAPPPPPPAPEPAGTLPF